MVIHLTTALADLSPDQLDRLQRVLATQPGHSRKETLFWLLCGFMAHRFVREHETELEQQGKEELADCAWRAGVGHLGAPAVLAHRLRQWYGACEQRRNRLADPDLLALFGADWQLSLLEERGDPPCSVAPTWR